VKVLFVVTSYPSVRAPHNGIFIREHARELMRRGVDVVVLAPRVFAEDPVHLDDDGIAVHRFGFWSEGKLLTEYQGIPAARMATYLLGGIRAGVSLVRSERPDVVHGHWVIPTGLIAVAASRIASGPPVLLTAHGSDVRVAVGGSAIAKGLARWTLDRAHRIVAVSDALAETLAGELGAGPARLEVVPMGVDTRLFAPSDRAAARAALGIAPEARLALYVGGLIPAKGVCDLIRAMPGVLPGDESVLMVLAGHGPLAAELGELAEQLGESRRVRLLGAVEHDRLPGWMNAADVLVLPSMSEGLPVCLMEAAAVGLPMIASDVGGSAEVVSLDPANALLDPGDVSALAHALSVGLARPSARRRESMLGKAPLFTLDGSVSRTVELYATLAGGAARC
jgi:teichuronic acid biosynthesis glycosyltransferase TuaC